MEWCRPNHGRRSSQPNREAPTQPSHPERVICTRGSQAAEACGLGRTSGKVAPERTLELSAGGAAGDAVYEDSRQVFGRVDRWQTGVSGANECGGLIFWQMRQGLAEG